MPVSVLPWQTTVWREMLARRQNLPHAMLFSGREGIGKIDFVRKLAQSLACETPAADGAACGECQSCRWFSVDAHPDYREIRPESMRNVDRDDSEGAAESDGGSAKRKPSQEIRIEDVRSGKMIVFYPAETLNVNAANALLKNLEEPPAGTRFMLVTHRPSDLPATIHSRCQRIAMPTPEKDVAIGWLKEQGIAEPALSLAQTGNAPLLALSLSDGDFWSQRKNLLNGLTSRERDMLALAEHYEKALAQLAARLRAIDLSRYHRALLRQQRTVNHPLSPRLYIEQMLLSYAAVMRGEVLENHSFF